MIGSNQMKLLSYEIRLVSYYILQTTERRAEIVAEAQRDPKTSGPLFQAYRAIEDII
jgi:hypothetical protein